MADDLVDTVVAATELALFVRGCAWLAPAFADLPTPAELQPGPQRGALRSVAAAGGVLVEVWEDAVVVHTGGGRCHEFAGTVPAGHDWMEVRTDDGLVSVDLSDGIPARRVAVSRRRVGWLDALRVWAAVAAPAALAPDHDPRTPAVVRFEPLALVTDGPPGATFIGIEASSLLLAQPPRRAAVAWMVSDRGVHVVADDRVVDPPVPPPPVPLRLVQVDGGWVSELKVRL